MCDAVKEWLGYEERRQPDWFWESDVDLKPLFAERSWMHTVWLREEGTVGKWCGNASGTSREGGEG